MTKVQPTLASNAPSIGARLPHPPRRRGPRSHDFSRSGVPPLPVEFRRVPPVQSRGGIVLDIETAPDEFALKLTSLDPDDQCRDAWPMFRVTAASMLRFDESPSGIAYGFELVSFNEKELHEYHMIVKLEERLPDPYNPHDRRLITFNGYSYDLMVLRHRAQANIAFSTPKLVAWDDHRHPTRHVDLMLEIAKRRAGKYPKLRHVAASLDLPSKQELEGTSVWQLAASGNYSQIARHCETDVVVTFLAYLHRQAQIRFDEKVLLQGWVNLADWILSLGLEYDHLEPYAFHNRVELAREMLRESSG